MRAVIISGGIIKDYDYIKTLINDDDYIICADSGFDHALKLGIKCDAFIGDMDSVLHDVKAGEIIKLNKIKDDTDTEAAVLVAINKGADEILMLAALGTRADHSLANYFLLKDLYKKAIKAKILDENNEIFYFEKEITLTGKKDDIISIIPINDLVGVYTEGLYYELCNDSLLSGKSRGVSNILIEESCTIKAEQGSAFIIKSKD